MNQTPSFKLKIINGNSADHIRISQSDAAQIYAGRWIESQLKIMDSESISFSEIEITPTMWLCIETIKKENP